MNRAMRGVSLGFVLAVAIGAGALALHRVPARATANASAAPGTAAVTARAGALITPPAHVAAALAPTLPYLKDVRIPVYLPSWLPPATVGEYYLLGAHPTAASYEVSFDFTNHPTPVNGQGMTSMAGTLGMVRGGPAGSLDAAGRQPWMQPQGTGRSIRLPNGHPATFYPGWGIRWTQGGWTYSVVSLGPAATETSVVMPLVRNILKALGPSGNPVGPRTTGQLFQDLAPDNAAMTLIWQQDGYQYEVWGYQAPAIRMAQSLVRVK